MGSLWNELKCRNVFRVGIACAVVAWLLIQVIPIVLPTFDAPRWVTQPLMFVIFPGFALNLFLAWAFELTPEGMKPASVSETEHPVAAQGRGRHKLNVDIIAALPFTYLSPDGDQEYFSDGLACGRKRTVSPGRCGIPS